MMIDVSDLRKRPRVNYTAGIFQWMTKLTNEELTQWEDETIREAKEKIVLDNREVKDDEIRAHVRNEAQLLERDYILLNFK
jgi:hypothetical protein